VVHPDGTVRWIEARGQAWVGEHGRLRGLRGSVLDVTELKRVEEGLRRALDEQRVIAAVAEAAAGAADEEELLVRTTAVLHDAFFLSTAASSSTTRSCSDPPGASGRAALSRSSPRSPSGGAWRARWRRAAWPAEWRTREKDRRPSIPACGRSSASR
jgi:PAS domain-containing protein